MNTIHGTWKSDEKLWKVFWLYALALGSVLLTLSDHVLMSDAFIKYSVYVVTLIWMIWMIWISVGLWQCAFNAKLKAWGFIVRGLVIFSIGIIAIETFGPYVGVDIYP